MQMAKTRYFSMKPTLDQALTTAKTFFAKSPYANEIAFKVAEGFTAFISKDGKVSTRSMYEQE